MNIRRLKHLEPERLRELVAANVQQILGAKASVKNAPSCGDACLLADTGDGRNALLSFDLHDANQALLRGLIALDRLDHSEDEVWETPDLWILSPTPPAGKCLLSRLRGFTWRAFEVIRVDDRLGLLVEEHSERGAAAPSRPATLHREEDASRGTKNLTPEEEAFFQHL